MNKPIRIKKAVLFAGLLSVALGIATLGGCVVVPAHRYAVRGDVIVGAPAPGFVWFDGYWSYGGRYGRHWVPGYWGRPRR